MDRMHFNKLLHSLSSNVHSREEFFDEYYLRLKIHLYRRFGKSVDIEDMVQDVFLKIFCNPPEAFIRYPTAWLFTVADHYVIDTLKSKGIDSQLPLNLEAPFDLNDVIIRADIKAVFLKLDKKTQEILYLHFWEGYNLKEVANLLNIKYGDVRVKVSRAYKILKDLL